MAMDTSSIRFSPGTLDRLRVLAHLRSLEAGREVSWNELVRECVEKHLLGGEARPRPGQTPAVAGQ
jgi:hypothetical protein